MRPLSSRASSFSYIAEQVKQRHTRRRHDTTRYRLIGLDGRSTVVFAGRYFQTRSRIENQSKLSEITEKEAK